MAEEDSFTSAMAKKANEYYDSLYPKAVAKPVGILAKLPWLKTLDADQQQNAILVADEAKKQGVPVNYALSVANAESGLMHDLSKPSKKGAIGIMQLLPTTAQEGNIDPNDINQNIQFGISYLKKQLDANNGNRRLASVAYNAGPDNDFFYGGKIPNETKKYLDRIKFLNGFEELKTPEQEEQAKSEQGQDVMKATGLGALAGAGIGTAEQAINLRNAFKNDSSGTKWIKNWAGQNKVVEGGVPEAANIYNRGKWHGPVGEKAQKLWGSPSSLDEPIGAIEKLNYRREMARKLNLMDKASSIAGKIPGLSILAGGIAGHELAQGAQDWQGGDKPLGAIKMIRGAGSALAMVPHPFTRIAGTGIALATEPAEGILSAYRRLSDTPEETNMPTEAEINANQRAAFSLPSRRFLPSHESVPFIPKETNMPTDEEIAANQHAVFSLPRRP